MSQLVRAAIVAACGALATAAEAAAREPIALTMDDALQRAEAESPLLRRARLERGVAEAQRVGAGLRLPSNPFVSVALGGRLDQSASVPPAQGFEAAVHLEQTLEVGGQRETRLAVVDAGLRVAQLREALMRTETRARARVAYVGAAIAQALAESARKREELGGRLLVSARARVSAGAASDVELRLAEVEAGRLRSERIDAELAEGDAQAELRRLLALPVDAPLRLTTAVDRPPEPAQPLAALIELAERRRADLQALAERAGQLDLELVRLRREVIPNPTLFVEYANQQPGQHYFGGGLGLPLPLARRNQGERALVAAERRLVDGERELLARQIAIEVERASRISMALRDEAERWQREVAPAAEAAVQLVEQGWRAGKFDLFRVIQASREAGEARRRQLERLGAGWQAAIELDRATGTP